VNENYASHRRKLLAFESKALPGPELIVASPRDVAAEGRRQTALAVPESMRTLGEPLEPFFEACGGRQSISLAVRRSGGLAPAETYVFQQPFVVIGRCRESDLPLNDRTVDFRHLYLQMIAGRWMFLDLQTIARGGAAGMDRRAWGWLDGERELTVGTFTIARVGDASPDLQPGPARPASEDSGGALPVVGLEFLSEYGPAREPQLWRIDGAVSLVGASRHCQLSLRDDSVSRVHASFVLTPRGLWIVDLLGRGSVLVNGRPAYWKQIHDGAELQIGRYRFRARFDARPRQSGVPIGTAPATEDLPALDRPVAALSGLSESSVADLLRHMTDTQSRFFEHLNDMQARFHEHSRNQTEFMLQVLAHMAQSQQASVRDDVARVERITGELEELKLQLARLPGPKTPRKPRTRKGPSLSKAKRREAGRELEPTPPEPIADGETEVPTPPTAETVLPADDAPRIPEPPSRTPPAAEPSPAMPADDLADEDPVDAAEALPVDLPHDPAVAGDIHARLTQRMARLAQERNAVWRRILAAFTGK
jgi:hypothetical protein